MTAPALPTSRSRRIVLDLSAATASGVLLWLSFAPLGQFYLAWIALVPLLWRLGLASRTRDAALLGLIAGMVFFLLGFHWLFNATHSGYLVVCGIMCSYWALAAALSHRVRRFRPLVYVPVVAMIWTAADYLRSTILGGFPWLQLGHTQTQLLAACQIVDITGVAGVTAWVITLNATFARLVLDRRTSVSAISFASIVTIALIAYGLIRIDSPEPSAPQIRVALVQSNHIHERSGAKTVTQQQQIDYLLYHSASIDADVIAWPETTMPGLNLEARTEPGLAAAPFLNHTFGQLSQLTRDRKAVLITGGYYVGGWRGEIGKRSATDIRNSVYAFSRSGELAGRYDKIRLVPFAEYIPFQEAGSWPHRLLTNFATASYAAGYRLTPASERTVFEIPTSSRTFRVVTPICFEDTIASLTAGFFKPAPGESRKRADLILNISNDGWFNAAEKALHLQIAQFRSIENRVPSARVSNTGQSAFIDSCGRITHSLAPFTEGVLIGSPTIDPRLTFYTRFGDVFAWICVGGSFLVVVGTLRVSRKTVSQHGKGENESFAGPGGGPTHP